MTEKTDPYDALLATIGVIREGNAYAQKLKPGDIWQVGDYWYCDKVRFAMSSQSAGIGMPVPESMTEFAPRRPIPRPTERILEAMKDGTDPSTPLEDAYWWWVCPWNENAQTRDKATATGWLDAIAKQAAEASGEVPTLPAAPGEGEGLSDEEFVVELMAKKPLDDQDPSTMNGRRIERWKSFVRIYRSERDDLRQQLAALTAERDGFFSLTQKLGEQLADALEQLTAAEAERDRLRGYLNQCLSHRLDRDEILNALTTPSVGGGEPH